jgi:hypothetical protein
MLWEHAKFTGVMPLSEMVRLAQEADALATEEARINETTVRGMNNSIVNVSGTLTDGRNDMSRHNMEDDHDLDSVQPGSTNNSSSSSSEGDTDTNTESNYSSSGEETEEESDSEDSLVTGDPDYDPEYKKNSDPSNVASGQNKTKKGGKRKISKSKNSRKSKVKSYKKAKKSRESEKKKVDAITYLAQANLVDPKCPLPVAINNKVAAADYLMWNMPKVCGFAYKAVMLNHKEYKEKGDITWDNWSFAVRDTCRNLGWSHDQSWRVATRLLPDNLQSHVYDMVQSKGFQGFCWNTWSLLVCKHTDQMNAITVAKHELATLAFNDNEQLPEFLSRFLRIVQKASVDSNGIEDPLTPLAILTHLNRVISNPGKKGPGWLVNSWKQQFSVVFGALRMKNTMGINDKGARYTLAECDANVLEVVSGLVEYLRNLHETRQTTTNDINVLYANTKHKVDILDLTGEPAPSHTSPSKFKFGKRKHNLTHTPGVNNPVAAVVTYKSAPKKAVSCRGSQPWPGQANEGKSGGWTKPQHTAVLSSAAMLAGPASELPEIPALDPKWAQLKALPPGVYLSPHAQAAVEYGVVPCDVAVERYKRHHCAACNRPRMECPKQQECIGLPPPQLPEIVKRSRYLWICAAHKRANK